MGERENACILKMHVCPDMTDDKRGLRQENWVVMDLVQGDKKGLCAPDYSTKNTQKYSILNSFNHLT
jgi:hypothetical protein